MRETAQIIGRREPFGNVYEWQGGDVASVTAEAIDPDNEHRGRLIGKFFNMGGLRLRVVERKCVAGMPYDAFYVMLANNPHSELSVLYRSVVHWVLRRVLRLEARVRGFMLQEIHGKEMPFTSRLYKKLI